MSVPNQLQVRIKEVPATVNPTPRPSTSGGRPSTAGGRPGTSSVRSSADFQQMERPEVVDYEQELENAYDSVIGAKQIEEASGGQDLDDVVRLTLQIDTSEKSISMLGSLVPNLRELTLDHSRIASVRDLGVDLRFLRAISLNDCGIDELDGIASLLSLEALSLRNNGISDVSPIAMHDKLQTLDLHGNRIFDISVGDTLSSCVCLASLVLSKNPIDRAPNYRAVICALIPQLRVLDSEPIDGDVRSKVTNAMILDASAAMNQIREEIEDEERLEMCIIDTDTAMYNPKSAKQNSFNNGSFNESSSNRIAGRAAVGAEPDTGSELTHGSDVVLAGGVAAAMRKRRANRTGEGAADSVRGSYESGASEEVNVIELLDAMTSGAAPRSGPQEASAGGSYLQEGDLTVSVLGHQPRPGTSGGRAGSGTSPRPSTSSRRQLNSQIPVLPASPGAPERKRGSGKRLLADADEGVNNVSFPDPFARPSSGGRPPRSPLLGTSSPRAASPFQHNETRPSTTMSNGRPFTSYSSYSDDGANLSELAVSAPSAPFKVSVPLAMRDEDLVALRSRLAPPSASCSEDEGADDHDTVLSGRSASSKASSRQREPSLRVSTARQAASPSALNDLDEYESDSVGSKKKHRDTSKGAEDLGAAGSSQVRGIALLGKPSIVHRDVVRRRAHRCGDDSESGSEDDEDILVDHNSRHSLMMNRSRGLLASGCSSPKVSSRGVRLGADLKAQMSGSRRVDAFAIEGEAQQRRRAEGSLQEDVVTSRPPMAPPSIAGRSLGFDLSGSLAAINQWVEDMDTGGSSDEEADEGARKIPASVEVQSSFQSEDGGQGSNLVGIGEEKLPTETAASRSSSVGLREDRSETSSHGSRSYNSANREILSRQKILSMCLGKEDRDADDSSLDNDILFIDVNAGSSKTAHTALTSINLAVHSDAAATASAAATKSTSIGSSRPPVVNTANVAILKPSNFNSSLSAAADGRDRSSQKYGGAVGDNSYRLSSRDEAEDVSEDDDEGDLNDLYAENLRMMDSGAQKFVAPNDLTSGPGVSKPKPSATEGEQSGGAKNRPSSLTTRISSSDLPDFETSPRGTLTSAESPREGPGQSVVKSALPGARNQSTGGATDLSDSELIEMLNRPPKTTYALRTKSNFQEFFRGMDSDRMKNLLEKAYAGEENDIKRRERVDRRMDLLRDVLVHDR